MYPVNNEFKAAVYAPTRSAKARVSFAITDVAATVTGFATSTEHVISDRNQLFNGKTVNTYNLASWELDRIKLDGTFCFPDPTLANNGEIGYVSSAMCGIDRTFNISIDTTFNKIVSTLGITVAFDILGEEYAEDFDVITYNGGVLLKTVQVRGNKETIRIVDGAFDNYNRVAVKILKWSKARRRARVTEIALGSLLVYDDSRLIRMSLVEDYDMTSGTVPAPQFQFTIDNSNREFNILNPTGVYKYLQERQKITAELAIIVNGVPSYVPIGEFILLSWQIDEGSMTATFNAGTTLDYMAGIDYERVGSSSVSPKYLAEQVFAFCGVTNYVLDSTLFNWAILPNVQKQSCRDVLRLIAMSAMSNLYVDRQNRINIKPLTSNTTVDRVDLDNMYYEPKIVLDRAIKKVEVAYYTSTGAQPIFVSVTNPDVIEGDTLIVEGNTLIMNDSSALRIANWLMAQKSYRGEYELNWRGNPAHELGDLISVENVYGVEKNSRIVKQELHYEGYLSGTTRARWR
ncbi:hypothetical protein [Bacillus sp. OK048]|uniref:hypothetical protein n=1 Tax=Bacillus sp. OK048 TaxID=1882761 RepID=UPI00089261A4|nr:hypothetical protein [Bacillus sp. OK048]SDM17279.1 hypothetical protein SAMN05443253_102161 [Bacillus sp. OK048]